MVNARLCETLRDGETDIFSASPRPFESFLALQKKSRLREGVKEKFERTRPLKFG